MAVQYLKSISISLCVLATIGVTYTINTLSGPPLYKQMQSKLGMDYGLIHYDLKNNCLNSRQCFISHIPKPTKSTYSRVGDALIGLATQNPQIDYHQVINPILADKSLEQKFLPRYLQKMGWTTTSPSGASILDPSKTHFRHDFKQAKQILISMQSQYLQPKDDEVVIYIRASDKLETFNNGTCNGGNCQQIILDYPDFIYQKAQAIMQKDPKVKHITIVAANYQLKKRVVAKQTALFTKIIDKLSTLTDSISLHSSNDLDEDIFYMSTCRYLIASENIGNLSKFVKSVHAASIS